MQHTVSELSIYLHKLHEKLNLIYAQTNPEGISIKQSAVLLKLRENGPTCPSVLAKALGVTYGAVTAISKQLIEKNLIVRIPSQINFKNAYLELTESGKKMAADIFDNRLNFIKKVTEGMSTEKIEEYIKATRYIAIKINE